MTNQLDQRIINAGFAAVADPQVFNMHGANAAEFQRLSENEQFKKLREYTMARTDACRQFYNAAVKLCRTEEERTLLKQYVRRLGEAGCGAQKPVQRFCR